MFKLLFFVTFIVPNFLGHSEVSVKLKDTFCYLRSVQINGHTNVSSFTLNYTNHTQTNISLNNALSKDLSELINSIEFKIPVKSIEAKNNNVLKDFQKLVKANKFEYVVVEIDEDEFLSVITEGDQGVMNLELVLAGQTRSINAKYLVHKLENDMIHLIGETQVRLSSFELVPPKKILGLVKVQDVIFITFDILIKTKLPN